MSPSCRSRPSISTSPASSPRAVDHQQHLTPQWGHINATLRGRPAVSRRIQTVPQRTYPWSTIDPERRNTMLLLGGISLVVLIAVVLAGYGYYHEKVAPSRETVLRVGNRSWTVDDLQRRTDHQIKRNQRNRADMAKNIEDTLKQMRDEELVRQLAKTNGITVTEEDLMQGYRDRFGLPPEASRDLITLNLRSELK